MELREIGRVQHDFSDDEVRDRAGKIEGKISIHPEYIEGLANLDRHQHIFVVSIMHKHLNEEFPLMIKPRLLLRKGYKLEDLPEIGVFSSDSPSRPNPIGLSLLHILKIEGGTIYVSGLDLFNDTPIADIKPYNRRYKVPENNDDEYLRDEYEEIGRH